MPLRILLRHPEALDSDGVALIRQRNFLLKHLRESATTDVGASTPNNIGQIIMITAIAAVLASATVVVTTHLLHRGSISVLASWPLSLTQTPPNVAPLPEAAVIPPVMLEQVPVPQALAGLVEPALQATYPTTAGPVIATTPPPPIAALATTPTVMVAAPVISKPAAVVANAPVVDVNTAVPPPRLAIVTAVAPKLIQAPVTVPAPAKQQATTDMPAQRALPPPVVREASPILAKRQAVGASAAIPYVTMKRADAGVEALDVNRVVIASKEKGAPISYALGNTIPGMGVLKMIDPVTSTIITDTKAIRLID